MDVDQEIGPAGCLGEQIVHPARHRLDRIERQSPADTNEKVPEAGGANLALAMLSVEPRSGPYQGFARPPFTALRVVATSIVELVPAPKRQAGRALGQAGATAKRERAARGHEPTQQRTTRRDGFLFQQAPADHMKSSGTPGPRPVVRFREA